jgi:hypothetical protein
MMRALVIVLAVLAGAKVWTQQRLYRQGAEEALLLAYRDRAIAACQSQEPARVASAGATLPLWTQPATVALAIGRKSARVNVWELDNVLWPARYKHPHVVLTTSPRAVCEYDVIEGRAYVGEL